MKKKKESPVPHELRDQPVPPAKGAPGDMDDVLLWPEGPVGTRPVASLDDTIIFDGWM
ncbi:MAG TPA: hypothetical protein IAA53_08800 [Candidatus Avoscillospira avicola]|uniref:Uncharacterized protein n=1 Tax=Candidatus Avoscillospira avicola TaxID=2840706 RepID=A0A9D1DIL0_9FIRM|nr:hypothetical protein [Candidatus Avoscillospira avicola]